MAETEKYAHVTFFFNGGRKNPSKGKTGFWYRRLKVATYDLKPEMSAKQVAEAMSEAVLSNEFAFVMGNLAPPDMVGHTGKFEETVKAVEATDEAIGIIYEACKAKGSDTFHYSWSRKRWKDVLRGWRPHTLILVPLSRSFVLIRKSL